MTQPKGIKRTIDNQADRKYEPAERKEMNHGRPNRKERNKKWIT